MRRDGTASVSAPASQWARSPSPRSDAERASGESVGVWEGLNGLAAQARVATEEKLLAAGIALRRLNGLAAQARVATKAESKHIETAVSEVSMGSQPKPA